MIDYIHKALISMCIAVGLVSISAWLLGDLFMKFWISTFIFLILMNALRER